MAFLYALAWYYKYSRDARGDFNIYGDFKNFTQNAQKRKTGEAGRPLLFALTFPPGTSQPGKRNGASFVISPPNSKRLL